jgi:hypothetical protein
MPCTVVLQSAGGDNRTTLVLTEEAEEVARRLGNDPTGFLAFEERGGQSIWINAANVLYVEPRGTGKAAGFS